MNIIAKLHPVAFGVSLGTVWGLSVFIMGIVATYFNYGVNFVSALSTLYLGYNVGIVGSLIGLGLGFLDGFIGGFLIGLIYNFIIKRS